MAWLNLSVLTIGGLLVGVPIVLHLVMRRKPRHLVFPALRFVQQRRDANRRRMQLRHWLLLLLRCLLILALAAALARPSVSSAAVGDWAIVGGVGLLVLIAGFALLLSAVQRRGKVLVGGLSVALLALLGLLGAATSNAMSEGGEVLLADEEAPVAAVMVFDTSPRMDYRLGNQTRLQQAQEMATELAKRLPRESDIAVLDSRGGQRVFSVDLAAANKRIEQLKTTGAPQPLAEVIDQALALVEGSERKHKEVYVFTDLTEHAWRQDDARRVQQAVEAADDVQLYIVDVGVEEPANFALADLQLSKQFLAGGGAITISAEVRHIGEGGSRTVELYVEEPDPLRPMVVDGETVPPEARRRSRQVLDFDAAGAQSLQFALRGLEPGVHHGHLRIVGEDGLAIDDERYFTIEVRPAWPLLVVAPPNVNETFYIEAVAPYELRRTGQASYDVTVATPAELATQPLEQFAAVCLLDPPPLSDDAWSGLADFAGNGGGVAAFLGHNAGRLEQFNTAAAKQVLGAPLARQWRAGDGEMFLAPIDYNHPITAAFRSLATSVPWSDFPIHRHWDFEETEWDAQTIIPYNNNKAALVERPLGEGRVLVMTTPISDPASPRSRRAWNELPTGENPWPYFVLVNELTGYLVSSGEERLNYTAGETAVLTNDPERHPRSYLLFTPGETPTTVRAREGAVQTSFTDAPGAYRLKGERDDVVVRGFSVNLPPEMTDLTRTDRERLDEFFGEDGYRFAREIEEIERVVGEERGGHKFYPYLMAMLVVVFGLEHALANRFYKEE